MYVKLLVKLRQNNERNDSSLNSWRNVMAQTGKEKKREGSSVRTLLALGFVSFFTDMSSEMVFSLLPPFFLVCLAPSGLC